MNLGKDIVSLIDRILHYLRYEQTQKEYNTTFMATSHGGVCTHNPLIYHQFYFNWRGASLYNDDIYNLFTNRSIGTLPSKYLL